MINKEKLNIRQARPADFDAILKLTYEAFLTLELPGREVVNEHYLIQQLKTNAGVIKELCLVAESAGEIVGHIAHTQATLKTGDNKKLPVATLAPLSVTPNLHKSGIGSLLVKTSLAKAKQAGQLATVVIGHPAYYAKFGFKPASDFNLALADNTSPAYFLIHPFAEMAITKGTTCHFLPIFDEIASDEQGLKIFHEEFLAKNYSTN